MSTAIEKTNGNGLAAPQAGTIQRQEFGAAQLARQAETATAAVAAQAKAEVEARYVMALQRPRDFDDVRARFLKECRRPSFAKVARYSKPVGGSRIEGPSIRFVEAALRAYGNVICPSSIIYEDRERRIVRVAVTDLETNVTYPSDIAIEKTVERKDTKGRVVLSERENSQGQTVYTVLATEDELLNKQGALLSKAIRTNGLRVLPGDLIEEGQEECIATIRDRAAKDPEAEKKAILDAFSDQGVPPTEIKKYLGHSLDMLVPAELVELRQVYAAIKDGEATWKETIEAKLAGMTMASQAPATPAGDAAQETGAAANALAGGAQPEAADPRLAEFEKALRESKPGPDRIKLMRSTKDYWPADLQSKAAEVFNRVTQDEAARG